jgi:large subunit ribosomal protein L5
MQRLKERYREEIVPTMMDEFGYDNVMEAPRIRKVVINIGVGEALDNPKAIEFAVNDLRTITGQQPIVIKSRKSIANFKLRVGRPVGVKVTLRGDQMWAFVDRLINVALPRTRDFRGVSDKLDGRGNYTLGLQEQLIFPEINYDNVDKARGMEVSFSTTAETDEEGRRLLELIGMPFRKS